MAESKVPTQEIRYGLIGVGMMGCEHIKNLQLLQEDGDAVRVVHIADPCEASLRDAQELLASGGQAPARQTSDYLAVIADPEVDVLVVSTPNFHHAEVLRAAAASGKHMLVEKPLCSTVEDCLAVRGLLEGSGHAYGAPGGPVFWVGMEYRYIRPIARLLEECDGGTVGDLRMVSIREHRYPFLIKVDDWNRFSRKTGGTLVEKCCHFFDLMLRIVGEAPLRVYASGAMDVNHVEERYEGEQPDIVDNAFVVVDFEGGKRGCLDLCMFAEASQHQEELCVVGDAGKVEAKIPVNEVIIGRRAMRGRLPITELPPAEEAKAVEVEPMPVDPRLLGAGYHEGSTFWEHKGLYRAILDGGTAAVAFDDGLMAVAVGAAAEISARERRPVMMSELVSDELRLATAQRVREAKG